MNDRYEELLDLGEMSEETKGPDGPPEEDGVPPYNRLVW